MLAHTGYMAAQFGTRAGHAPRRIDAGEFTSAIGHALTLRFDPDKGGADTLGRHLVDDAFPLLAALSEIAGVHLLIADQSASTMVPVERKGRPTIIPNWIVVLEGISLAALDFACDRHLAKDALRAQGCADAIERETYSLQLLVARPQ